MAAWLALEWQPEGKTTGQPKTTWERRVGKECRQERWTSWSRPEAWQRKGWLESESCSLKCLAIVPWRELTKMDNNGVFITVMSKELSKCCFLHCCSIHPSIFTIVIWPIRS